MKQKFGNFGGYDVLKGMKNRFPNGLKQIGWSFRIVTFGAGDSAESIN